MMREETLDTSFDEDDENEIQDESWEPDDVEETQPSETGEKPKPYFSVDPWKLDEELSAWCQAYKDAEEAGKERPQMNNYLGDCIMKIARGISSRFNFIGYTYKEEMIGDAYIHVMTYINKYNNKIKVKSGNPPAYSFIYRMCWNAFTNRINFEEREQIKKYRSLEALGGVDLLDGEESISYGEEEKSSSTSIVADYMNKIYEYEEKINARKKAKEDKKRAEEPEVVEKPLFKNDNILFFMESEE